MSARKEGRIESETVDGAAPGFRYLCELSAAVVQEHHKVGATAMDGVALGGRGRKREEHRARSCVRQKRGRN